MAIKITVSGSKDKFSKTLKFLGNQSKNSEFDKLDEYGRKGVSALKSLTPKDTGKTANSWSYDIHREGNNYEIEWFNSNINKHVNVALLIQYGHATRNGGYVTGIDYINPAIQSVADEAASDIRRGGN